MKQFHWNCSQVSIVTIYHNWFKKYFDFNRNIKIFIQGLNVLIVTNIVPADDLMLSKSLDTMMATFTSHICMGPAFESFDLYNTNIPWDMY